MEIDKITDELRNAIELMDRVPTRAWAIVRTELLRLSDENARILSASRDAVDHFERTKAELAESRETIKRLNRRLQRAESGIAEKVSESDGRSLGRSLANAAAETYIHERDGARAELDALKARIAEAPITDLRWEDFERGLCVYDSRRSPNEWELMLRNREVRLLVED